MWRALLSPRHRWRRLGCCRLEVVGTHTSFIVERVAIRSLSTSCWRPQDLEFRSRRDAVQARLARIPAPARSLLQAAALCGPRVDPWLLERIIPSAAASLDACLDAGLLTNERNQLIFRHELVREAVLDTLPAHRHIA